MPYLGRQPGVGVRNRYIYTATASQTTFSGADDNGATLAYDDAAYVDVYLNGVLLIPVTDYAATTKTSIVLTSGAAVSDLVEILAYEIASIADTVSKANGGTFDGAVTVNNNFVVDNGTIKLDGNYPTGSGNVALGDAAGDALTTGGDLNTFVGSNAGSAVVTGDNNTAIGAYAFDAGTGSSNTGVGSGSLGSASNTGSYNTAIGHDSLQSNTTASGNTAVGYLAATANTTGEFNTAIGREALEASTTSNDNTAVGFRALTSNTTGASNVGVGREALSSNTTASNNTAVGYQAGYTGTTATANTVVGKGSGYSATTGSYNTFVGDSGGYYVTTGAKNTILGRYNGNQGGVDIRTSSNNIVLSDGDGNPRIRTVASGHTRLSPAQGSADSSGDRHIIHNSYNGNYIAVLEHSGGNSPYGINLFYSDLAPNNTTQQFIACEDISTNRFLVYSNGNVVNRNNSYGAISDEKLKENIVDSGSQWDDIKALRVRKYSMKEDALDAPNRLGVVAQEVEAAGMGGLVFESPDRDRDNNDLGTVTKQVNYSVLYMKAVKALQEAMERIETLEAKVAALENA